MPLISIMCFMTLVQMITELREPRRRAGGKVKGEFGFEKCALKEPANPYV